VGINFLNDAYGGSAATDRNLYVSAVSLDGTVAINDSASLMSGGIKSFIVPAPILSSLTLNLSEDAYAGDARFSVAIDGQILGAAQAVATLHSSGNAQSFVFNAALSAGKHDIAVSFLNDAYGGSTTTDRNLYINGASVGGTAVNGIAAALMSNGTSHFSVVAPALSS
jgi:hypothetical protein